MSTRADESPAWQDTTVIGDDVVERIAELKRRPGNELQVHGSCTLAHTLIDHDLVDEYRLWTYPVVLGHGRRLFREGALPTALDLVGHKRLGSGCVVNVYRPVGRPTYGDVVLESEGEVVRGSISGTWAGSPLARWPVRRPGGRATSGPGHWRW